MHGAGQGHGVSLLGVERSHVELRVAMDDGLGLAARPRVLADPLAVCLDERAAEAELAVLLEHDEPAISLPGSG